jgi:alkylation response protein AidB-like acyl-CoA dehydrogenase
MTTKQTHPTTADALADIARRLTAARAVVSVTAQALDHGESDLEIHAADALKPAAEALDEILDVLASMRFEAEPPRRLSAKARLILGEGSP